VGQDGAICGGLLRPDVVWFGETPNRQDDIKDELECCDLLLVIGTSGTVSVLLLCFDFLQGFMNTIFVRAGFRQVYPAAGFADVVYEVGGKIAVFNLNNVNSEYDDIVDFCFLGPCEETVPRVLGLTRE
jgi:NAD-dependent deacetylase sirtuin 5